MFTPVVSFGGYSGWRFLNATLDRQQDNFDRSPELKRRVEYFRSNFNQSTSVDSLIKDREMMQVALGAYGLSDDLNKGAFVRKVLDEGSIDQTAFANRLGSRNYRDFAAAFSYGDGGLLVTDGFIDNVIDRYQTLEFEKAIGEEDNDLRLALNFRREIGELAVSDVAGDTAMFRILGSRPLREVMQSVFNLPPAFASIDIDRQVDVFQEKFRDEFGSDAVQVFQNPELVEDAIRKFLVRQSVNSGPSPLTPGFAALALLTGGRSFSLFF